MGVPARRHDGTSLASAPYYRDYRAARLLLPEPAQIDRRQNEGWSKKDEDDLVALDTSLEAGEVLATAGDLAKRMDPRLIVLRVVSRPTELPPEAYTISPEKWQDCCSEPLVKIFSPESGTCRGGCPRSRSSLWARLGV